MCRTLQRATFRLVHVCAYFLFYISLILKFNIRAYLVVATFTLSLLGYQNFMDCIGITYQVMMKQILICL